MNIESLFWQLITTKGEDWLEASLRLQELGYSWEWTWHKDGTNTYALKDKEIEA